MKKTLLIGLDAACWAYLQPLLQAGRLPTVQRLMEAGAWGTLQSTMPPLTPVAWASIATGKNPGKHGVYDMLARRPGTNDFAPADARQRLGTPFWQRLNERGVRVGLVNVPFTYPFDRIDGFWVAGFGTPISAPDVIYPTDLQAPLEEKFGRFAPTVDPQLLKSALPLKVFEAERDHQAAQVAIAAELAAKIPVEVLVINLMLLDHANHLMPEMALVEQAICESDADLDKLLRAFQPDDVMLISDHGSRRVKGDFLLHAWLRDQGYSRQRLRDRAGRDKALNWILKQWFQGEYGWSGAGEKALRRLGRSIIPLLPGSLAGHFWRRLEATIPSAREHVRFGEELDEARSSILLGGSYSGVLYLNGADEMAPARETETENRVVPLTADLVARLAEITDPDSGRPLFSAVHTSDELYDGPAAQFAPEIILDGYDAQWNILGTFRRGAMAGSVRDRYFVPSRRDYGHHSRDGIYIFSGPDFAAGPSAEEGHVMDIPATLLHLYDVPIPEDYDGRIISETLDPLFLSHHTVAYQPGDLDGVTPIADGYSSQESEELLDHLRALGYVD